MALTAVETTLMGLFDRWAYQRAAAAFAGMGGTRNFARVDASGDEAFELAIGAAAHDADDELGRTAELGSWPLGKFSNLKLFVKSINNDYCVDELALSGLDAYLTAQGWRVDYRTAQICDEAGYALSLANIGGAGDQGAAATGVALGDLTRGGALVAGTDIDATLCDGAPVLARVTVLGASDWTVSTTMKLWDDSTKVISQVVSGTGAGGAVGDVYVIGKQAVGTESASGQKVVSVAATAQFKAGQKVLLTLWSGSAPNEVWLCQEVATIDTIQTNTSLTMVGNLKHTYTTNAFVYPLGFGVTAASGTGGSASDRLYYYPAPDRRLKL